MVRREAGACYDPDGMLVSEAFAYGRKKEAENCCHCYYYVW